MVEDVDFIYCSRSEQYYTFDQDIIQIEDMDDDGLIEYMIDIFDIILDKDNEEVLRKLAPKPSGIGSPTNHEEFQEGVKLAQEVYFNFLSLFFNQKVEDGFASSLGLLTEYQKGVSYRDKLLEDLIRLYEQEPTKETPNGPVTAYDLLVQYSEDLIREGKQFPQILRPFAADVLADTRRDEAEKKRPRPKHPRERAGRKRIFFIRDKGWDIAILALVREGWTEVGNEDKIPSDWPYSDSDWANSAVFGVAVATGKSFGAVKSATTKYRRQREANINN